MNSILMFFYKLTCVDVMFALGLDWGGLRREWFELLCVELFDPSNSDFFHRFTSDTQGLVSANIDHLL